MALSQKRPSASVVSTLESGDSKLLVHIYKTMWCCIIENNNLNLIIAIFASIDSKIVVKNVYLYGLTCCYSL